ncbi:uncharacterized protein Z518_05867 [Rhinocladiella mackenziei CBS 650.93]|uniref:GST N-terminal domain-containing protein n=1 Tax=Rhinocladiella mackenziei CBS 650.93 TaxID=1442369 RepID=A0A0D2J7H3_9EURO|nr:uncharacterized protein Z518_05867 [Rhinocladiella mackenziei CBS 650.93]KIX04995.1 hypothetical protein Z518_05867 [Rhinocladiella mackenziei CBS 650.93]
MDADTLQNFAAPVQPIQFPAYAAGTAGAVSDAAAENAGYAPADSTEANIQALGRSMQNGNSTSPRQTRRQSSAVKSATTSPAQSTRSPQQTRVSVQTRASQNAASTPSRQASITTAPAVPPQVQATPVHQRPDNFQEQEDMSQATQNKSNLVWKNSTSSFPNGTPTLTRSQSRQSQVYTTPQGLIHSDPWASHHHSAPQNNNPSDNDPETDPAVAANPFSDTFPLIPNPPDLDEWRHKLFNITEPLVLSEEEFLTYFPHVDNVYSHRSTQKYKRKAFVSHYWDCRLKGRPSGTPKSDDPNKKKRKRQARERDLCDVKIKVTEYFSDEEARKQGLNLIGADMGGAMNGTARNSVGGNDMSVGENSELTIVLEDGVNGNGAPNSAIDPNFGLLELPRRLPKDHPGADGKRWFTIQRVRGNPGGGAVKEKKDGEREDEDESVLDPNLDLDHKHTLEESDRIKKNSVQRWLLKEEKEKKRLSKPPTTMSTGTSTTNTESSSPTFRASGLAFFTVRSHSGPVPSKITFFANSFCPFAQRIWIALEIKGVPYQMVEVMPAHLDTYRPPEMLEVNPDGHIPCIRHGNWGVWESGVILEYLEDLAMGHSLLPLGNPQLRAHCRLWTDHINRKILPNFYSLLFIPPPGPPQQQNPIDEMHLDGQAQANAATAAQHSMLIATLQKNITSLVNASHATGPFFLGSEIGFVDVVFAPWIIRLSRVLSYYRNFPRPEVGTRWRQWVDAIEADDRVRRTVSDENSYHSVYRGVGEDGWDSLTARDGHGPRKAIIEIQYAKRVVAQEGFGLGGDVWGRLSEDHAVQEKQNMEGSALMVS